MARSKRWTRGRKKTLDMEDQVAKRERKEEKENEKVDKREREDEYKEGEED